MAKAKIYKSDDDSEQLVIQCPGCGHHHIPTIKAGTYHKEVWDWNKSLDRPTISPSLLVRIGHYASGEKKENCELCKDGHNICKRCHSFIRDGRIQFLSDCTHHLAGQTVELPDIS